MINFENNLSPKNNFLFNRYRTQVRFYFVPIFLLFGIPDYFVFPEFFYNWFSYRLLFAAYIFLSFYLMVKFKAVRNQIKFIIYGAIFLACGTLTKIIIDTGGHASIYLPGLMLTGLAGVQLLRLSTLESLIIQVISYAPAITYLVWSTDKENMNRALTQASFLLGMAAISHIFKISDGSIELSTQKFMKVLNDEVTKLRKSEILNQHFPKVIRESIENNPNLIHQKRILPTAVVGFADIVSSSAISNKFPLSIEWELKERFLDQATKRAMEHEMVVLTHVGDGFLFIANFQEGSQWYYNLILFYEKLIKDYEMICKDLNLQLDEIVSGLKFGITQGPVAIGFIGQSQSYYTAVGPDVNLASRLCDKAKPNQLVVSSRVWNSLKPILVGWANEPVDYSNLKGFDYVVPAVHLYPRDISLNKTEVVCSICDSSMSLVKTDDGLLDYRCVNGHTSPKMAAKS
jgi:class 3 adenylate cyclase